MAKVKIVIFREIIGQLERIVNYNAHMCVSVDEIQNCVSVCKTVRNELINLECSTTKPADLLRKATVLDRSFHFIEKNKTVNTPS